MQILKTILGAFAIAFFAIITNPIFWGIIIFYFVAQDWLATL